VELNPQEIFVKQPHTELVEVSVSLQKDRALSLSKRTVCAFAWDRDKHFA
jgi:hypothetical protein